MTGIVNHAFWANEGYPHVWDFFKNFGHIGGVVYVMYGSGVIQTIGSDIEQVFTLNQPALAMMRSQ